MHLFAIWIRALAKVQIVIVYLCMVVIMSRISVEATYTKYKKGDVLISEGGEGVTYLHIVQALYHS